MPSDPRGAPLKRWCLEVMTTLQQLKNSGVEVGQSVGSRSTSSTLCAFGRATDGETEGTKVLTMGNIIAGGDTVSKGGEFGPELTPVDGHFVWAEVEIEATVSDGVLTSAYTATGHTISSGATEPDDHEWTPDDETGKAYRVLGYWEETEEDVFVFHGYECGSVNFDFCAKNTVRGYAKSWRG